MELVKVMWVGNWGRYILVKPDVEAGKGEEDFGLIDLDKLRPEVKK
jgi:hypothetical protein